MRTLCPHQLFLSFLFSACATAGSLSDSAYIEGHFSQRGESFSRRQVEKFLLSQNAAAVLADESKGMRLSAWAIGASLWCVTAGISAYQAVQFIDAVKKQQPVSPNIDRLALPLSVGSEIAVFVQSFFSNRSEFLLHKAATAYNNSISARFPPDTLLDHRIRKTKNGWFQQDRVLFPLPVLYPLLRENDASRGYAFFSGASKWLSDQGFAVGSLFLALAAIGYIEKDPGTLHRRRLQLWLGIGMVSFGTGSAVASSILRSEGIEEYNRAVR